MTYYTICLYNAWGFGILSFCTFIQFSHMLFHLNVKCLFEELPLFPWHDLGRFYFYFE